MDQVSKPIKIEIEPNHLMNCLMEHQVQYFSNFTTMENILHIFNKVAGKKIVGVSKISFLKNFEKNIDYDFHIFCSNNECSNILKIKPGSKVEHVTCKNENCKTLCNIKQMDVAFVTFELESQLRDLLESNKDDLIAPDQPWPEYPIKDVWSCKIHHDILMNIKKPFISLTLNTDGIALFNSNTKSLWPIILSVNNLQLRERFKQNNLIVCGFHLSNDLDMATFLESLIMEVQKLNNEGGIALSFGKMKIFCTLASLDAPAKAKLQNMMQYNGHFGCPYCVDEGVYINGSVRFSIRY